MLNQAQRGARFTLGIALLAVGFSLHAADPLPVPDTLSAKELQALVPELRKGGYVFYFRHATTRQDQEDRQPIVKDDCSTQRNLSDEGKRQAAMIGAAFRNQRLPVGRVVSSPFCRCVETSRLAFATPTITDDLYFAVGLSKAERQAKGQALQALLTQLPASGTNTVIVAHTANLEEAVGFWPKPEGAAILFQPDGKGGFAVVGRVPPEAWAGMGMAAKP